MLFRAPKKAGTVLLVWVYFSTQSAFAHQTESSLWTERRRAMENAERPTPTLAQLPSIFATVPAVFAPPAWARLNAAQIQKLSPALQDAVGAIPLTHAIVQEIHGSNDEENPPVVIVQDVHMNSEAQANIAVILAELMSKKKTSLIGVEGAFDRFDFAPIRAIANKSAVREVAQAYLDKNLLAAASYAGITSADEPPPFVGIDDKRHYDDNVQAYLESRLLKADVQRRLDQDERALAGRKAAVFPADLKQFDERRQAYRKGTLGLGAYIELLVVSHPLETKTHPNLARFQQASALERTLDFTRVEEERRRALQNLTAVLTPRESQELIAQSLAYKMGRLGFGRYYENLKELCDRKGVALHKTPAFAAYLRYAGLADSVNAAALFDELETWEQHIATALTQTPKQKQLLDQSEHLSLTRKLTEFALTPKEWEQYKKLKAVSYTLLASNLKSFEDFYEQADIRSHKIIGNLFAAAYSLKLTAHSPVLIVGGFHTPLITQLLKERKIPYVVVSPKITKVDSAGSAYLSAFAREKTPLEKLVAGERLFLAPKNQWTDLWTAARVLGSALARGAGVFRFPFKILGQARELHTTIINRADPTQDQLNLPPLEKLYLTIGVNWENAVFWIIPLAWRLMPDVGWAGAVLLIPAAILFALLHKEQRSGVFVTALFIGLPFAIPGIGFAYANALSMLKHTWLNTSVLLLRSSTNPALRRIGNALPLASLVDLLRKWLGKNAAAPEILTEEQFEQAVDDLFINQHADDAELERQLDNRVAGLERYFRGLKVREGETVDEAIASVMKSLADLNSQLLHPLGYHIDRDEHKEGDQRLLVLYKIVKKEVRSEENWKNPTLVGSPSGIRFLYLSQITEFPDRGLRGSLGWSSNYNEYVLIFSQRIQEELAPRIRNVIESDAAFFDIPQKKFLADRAKTYLKKGLTGLSTEQIGNLLEQSILIHEWEHERRRRILKRAGIDRIDLTPGEKSLDERLSELRAMQDADEPFHVLAQIYQLIAKMPDETYPSDLVYQLTVNKPGIPDVAADTVPRELFQRNIVAPEYAKTELEWGNYYKIPKGAAALLPPASLFDPVLRLFVEPDGATYIFLTTGLFPWLETWFFHSDPFGWFGGNIYVIAAVFSASHYIMSWVARAIDTGNWRPPWTLQTLSDAIILFALSLLFSLPFVSHAADPIFRTTLHHSLYNAAVLILRAFKRTKRFGEALPLASLDEAGKNERQDPRMIERLMRLYDPTQAYVRDDATELNNALVLRSFVPRLSNQHMLQLAAWVRDVKTASGVAKAEVIDILVTWIKTPSSSNAPGSRRAPAKIQTARELLIAILNGSIREEASIEKILTVMDGVTLGERQFRHIRDQLMEGSSNQYFLVLLLLHFLPFKTLRVALLPGLDYGSEQEERPRYPRPFETRTKVAILKALAEQPDTDLTLPDLTDVASALQDKNLPATTQAAVVDFLAAKKPDIDRLRRSRPHADEIVTVIAWVLETDALPDGPRHKLEQTFTAELTEREEKLTSAKQPRNLSRKSAGGLVTFFIEEKLSPHRMDQALNEFFRTYPGDWKTKVIARLTSADSSAAYHERLLKALVETKTTVSQKSRNDLGAFLAADYALLPNKTLAAQILLAQNQLLYPNLRVVVTKLESELQSFSEDKRPLVRVLVEIILKNIDHLHEADAKQTVTAHALTSLILVLRSPNLDPALKLHLARALNRSKGLASQPIPATSAERPRRLLASAVEDVLQEESSQKNVSGGTLWSAYKLFSRGSPKTAFKEYDVYHAWWFENACAALTTGCITLLGYVFLPDINLLTILKMVSAGVWGSFLLAHIAERAELDNVIPAFFIAFAGGVWSFAPVGWEWFLILALTSPLGVHYAFKTPAIQRLKDEKAVRLRFELRDIEEALYDRFIDATANPHFLDEAIKIAADGNTVGLVLDLATLGISIQISEKIQKYAPHMEEVLKNLKKRIANDVETQLMIKITPQQSETSEPVTFSSLFIGSALINAGGVPYQLRVEAGDVFLIDLHVRHADSENAVTPLEAGREKKFGPENEFSVRVRMIKDTWMMTVTNRSTHEPAWVMLNRPFIYSPAKAAPAEEKLLSEMAVLTPQEAQLNALSIGNLTGQEPRHGTDITVLSHTLDRPGKITSRHINQWHKTVAVRDHGIEYFVEKPRFTVINDKAKTGETDSAVLMHSHVLTTRSREETVRIDLHDLRRFDIDYEDGPLHLQLGTALDYKIVLAVNGDVAIYKNGSRQPMTVLKRNDVIQLRENETDEPFVLIARMDKGPGIVPQLVFIKQKGLDKKLWLDLNPVKYSAFANTLKALKEEKKIPLDASVVLTGMVLMLVAGVQLLYSFFGDAAAPAADALDPTVRQTANFLSFLLGIPADRLLDAKGAPAPSSRGEVETNIRNRIAFLITQPQTPQTREELIGLQFILHEVLADSEYAAFLTDLAAYIERARNVQRPENTILLLDTDPVRAKQQANEWIRNLRDADGNMAANRVLYLAVPSDAVRAAVADFASTRVRVIDRGTSARALLARIADKKDAERFQRFLVTSMTDLPNGYLDFSGVSEDLLRQIAVDWIMTQIGAVAEFHGASLLQLETRRATLISA